MAREDFRTIAEQRQRRESKSRSDRRDVENGYGAATIATPFNIFIDQLIAFCSLTESANATKTR
jgi:hypothetical protein